MRDASIACLREIGVDTGGSNVQFAFNPENGRMVIVEMNPRVSRSSALASKATGFPIAKIAAKLAVGYRLDEIPNDITRKTPACFEPTIDYVVVKIPRWQFEKFPGAEPVLTTQMKSVGEVMSIGRTFRQALNKGLRSLETGRSTEAKYEERLIPQRLTTPNPERLGYIRFAFERGWSVEDIYERTQIDPWFLRQVRDGVAFEQELAGRALESVTAGEMRLAKRDGLSDTMLARLWKSQPLEVRARRKELGVRAVFNRVDTCAAEFESFTPYLYSSYESECEAEPSEPQESDDSGQRPEPDRAGHRVRLLLLPRRFALQEFGIESIMVNCNPETVSTDYDTSDRLYFEPLTLEEVLNIYDTEKPDGVIVQFGGQTPLNLALAAEERGRADHRHRPRQHRPGRGPQAVRQAAGRAATSRRRERGTATSVEEACETARSAGLPGAGAAELRAGRAGHGDRLRRGDRAALYAGSGACSRRSGRC